MEDERKFILLSTNYMTLTKRYGSSRALCAAPPSCDAFICGSDQIWNPIITFGVVPAYYLSFVRDERRKCAYAPSFGTQRLPDTFTKKMKRYISAIPTLSIRESSSGKIVEEWAGRKPRELIDPTFLITQKDWDKVAAFEGTLPEHYLLIYINLSIRAIVALDGMFSIPNVACKNS